MIRPQILQLALLAFCALLAGSSVACNRAPDHSVARVRIQQGKAAGAEALLEGRDDPEALELLDQLARLKEQQDRVRRRIAEVEADRQRRTRNEVIASLRELSAGGVDPVSEGWIDAALSRNEDWFASQGSKVVRPDPAEDSDPALGASMESGSKEAGARSREGRRKVKDPYGDEDQEYRQRMERLRISRQEALDLQEREGLPGSGSEEALAETSSASGEKPREEEGSSVPAGSSAEKESSPSAARTTGATTLDPAARKELLARLDRARGGDRDAALEACRELSPEELRTVLDARQLRAWRALDRGFLRRMEVILELRSELDRHRRKAIDLIRDQERYFYPYEPPAVSGERAAEYRKVQHEIEQRTARAREFWEDRASVPLTRSLRQAIDELRWLDRVDGWQGKEDPPDWLLVLDTDLDQVDVTSFAWDERGAEELRYNRAVRAYNEERWARIPIRSDGDSGVPGRDEVQQVRVTNDYRELLGVHCLAWNPVLQRSARGHAEFLGDGGEFGHEQPTQMLRTPARRMRAEGYPAPLHENSSALVETPEAVHGKWIRSSAHHRILLDPVAREMASARAQSFWNQNFGADKTFFDSLDPWQN